MWDEYLSGCIPEPDLTNFAVYNAIGGELDHETTGCPNLQDYERKYAIAVAYHDSVSSVPPDRRLWAGSRPCRPPRVPGISALSYISSS
jgi:hypothetical protein